MAWIDILGVLLLLTAVLSMRPVRGSQRFHEAYLSRETGKNLRGLFALVVLFHHLAQRVNAGSLFLGFRLMGFVSVAVYFFLSGYGLQISHMNSPQYRKTFLRKRLWKLLLPYALVTFLYWLENLRCGVVYSLVDVFGQILKGDPIAMFSWYIVCIALFYLAYWLLMHLCKENYKWMVAGACLWTVGYVALCIHLGFGQWWYNTPHLLVAGMLWAIYEKKILLFLKNHYALCVAILVAGLPLAAIGGRVPEMLTALCFALLVVVLSGKLRLQSAIFEFFGEISLELYLLHGLWIGILRAPIGDDSLWAFCVTGCSILSAWLLHWLLRLPKNLRRHAP